MCLKRVEFWPVMLGAILAPWSLNLAFAAADDVRVMSFNIRYGTAQDGANHWDRRKEFVVETIRAFNPDLLGTQETLGFQRDYLAGKLPEYDSLGVGRDDGGDRGEMMALFYKRDRFEKLDGGHFWLSETPDKIGSKSWDSSLPRMVTWVKLRDRLRETAPPLLFYNTHFDHQGETARLESARLIRRRIADQAGDGSVIVTGDFNCGEGSPPYQALFGPVDDRPSPLHDSYRANNPDRKTGEGTFTGFKPGAAGDARIDWIGVSRDWQIRSAAIDRTARDGRTPSDHYPVTSILRRKSTDSSAVRRTGIEEPLFGGDYPVESHLNLPYHDGPDADRRKHKLDLYVPKGARNFPVLFFVHGGGWTSGDRKLYAPLGSIFARNGIGTVITSYRLSPGVRHPEHVRDVARAFAWTRQHIAEYGGRRDRVFVSGQSAGGHLAALLCSDETYLKAHGLSLGSIRGAIPISGVYAFWPGTYRFMLGTDSEAARNASPITHVSGDEPPFLILHAISDIPGCAGMSQSLLKALRGSGVQAECQVIENRNHLTIIFLPMLGDRDPTVQRILRFIARHSELELKPRSAEPGMSLVYCSAAKDQSLVVLRLDSQSGTLSNVARLATPGEPAALATSPDGRFLFASMRSTGRLASFRIDRKTGELTPLSEVAAGADPAQIAIDKTGKFLLTAYYVAAKVSVHAIAEDGTLSERPVQEVATDEKAHTIALDPQNQFAYVPHTGPDTIFQFRWNGQTGQLTPHAQARLVRPRQSGPRHLAWHPTRRIAYIDNEQGSSVTVYQQRDDGSLLPGQTVSTLPPEFRGSNSTAEIKIHPGGRFLYVSNRGHDSLALFRIDDSGTGLTFIAAEPTEATPRSFDIDPSGRFLLSAGESSGRLAVSKIEGATGRLTPTSSTEIGPKLWWVHLPGGVPQ